MSDIGPNLRITVMNSYKLLNRSEAQFLHLFKKKRGLKNTSLISYLEIKIYVRAQHSA